MQVLQRGQRVPLTQLTLCTQLQLLTSLPMPAIPDISILGLDEQRKLADDRYFIFYNQPKSPEGALRLNEEQQAVTIDLEKLPSHIHRLLLIATCEDAPFSGLGTGTVLIQTHDGEVAQFELSGSHLNEERALMLIEIYRHQGGWRVAAIGEGFSGGLKALLESLGGEVIEDEPVAQVAELSQKSWGKLQSAAILRHNPEGLRQFRGRFLSACADAILEHHEWQDLQRIINQEGLDASQALKFIRGDAILLLERTLVLMRSDGEITGDEIETFETLIKLLEVPESLLLPLRKELHELQEASDIRKGKLPTIKSSLILESGEVAHLEMPVSYRQITAKRRNDLHGTLVLTNRQLHFVGPEGGWTVQYGKILRIEEILVGVNVDLSIKRGSGLYQTDNPLRLAATLDALVRIHKRHLLMPQTSRATRHIPQKVKLAVWQRDQGKCGECGATEYLEFDHIIPHSLGGASTEGNLQLLCRACNLAKRDRI